MGLRDMRYIGFKHQRENKQKSDKKSYCTLVQNQWMKLRGTRVQYGFLLHRNCFLLINMLENFIKFLNFQKISKCSENFKMFKKFQNVQKISNGLGAIRAKIGPTSDVDKMFSKMYSQYVLFRNKYS